MECRDEEILCRKSVSSSESDSPCTLLVLAGWVVLLTESEKDGDRLVVVYVQRDQLVLNKDKSLITAFIE